MAKWIGGPLDGAIEPRPFGPLSLTWYGPDPADPHKKILVYILHSGNEYRYDQNLTDKANQFVAEQRALQSEPGGEEPDSGGQTDGTRAESSPVREDRRTGGES